MTEKYVTIIPAVHLFLIQEGKILLLRRFNTGYEDGKYSVPAGHVEKHETATQAMVREAAEETGITINPSDLNVVHIMQRQSDQARVDWFFIAMNWIGEPMIKEPDKCDELAWYSFDALPPMLIPYVRSAIEKYQNGVFYSEFG